MTATTELEPTVRSDPAPPCEHSEHQTHHVPPDEPAKFYVRVTCFGCGRDSRYYLCTPGLDRMTRPNNLLRCVECKWLNPWEDSIWILEVLP